MSKEPEESSPGDGRVGSNTRKEGRNEAQLRANAQEVAHGTGRAQPPVRLGPSSEAQGFYPVVLPAKPLDEQIKGLWLPGRTLVGRFLNNIAMRLDNRKRF